MGFLVKRIKSGIPGLDDLIEGGFPDGRSILLSGACGTGKTIFCAQYIYFGAQKFSEPGIIVTLDERPALIRQDMLTFGWDLKKLEEENMIQIIDGSIAKIGLPSEEEFALPATGFDLDKLLLEIMRVSKRIGAKRIVIDSLPSLGFNFKNENDVREAILKLSYILTRMGATSMMTSEIRENKNQYGKYGVEEYVVDSVIVLSYQGLGTQSNRTLHVRKMRATKHSEAVHNIQFTNQGIQVVARGEDYDFEKTHKTKKTKTDYDKV